MRRHARIVLVIAALLMAVVAFPLPGGAAPRTKAGGLAGTVYGQDGAPLAGATVVAYSLPDAQASCAGTENDWRAVTKGMTRADGTFQLGVKPGYYRLGVMPSDLSVDSFGYWLAPASPMGPNVTSWVGFGDDLLVPTNGRTGVVVRLDEPRAITGTVTEYGTGTPIAGAEVRFVPLGVGQLARNVASVRTDASGAYVFGGLPLTAPDPDPLTIPNEAREFGMVAGDPTGWHELWLWWWSDFDPFGRSTPVVIVSDPGETYERSAALRASGRIAGKVVSDKGRPLGGIEVTPTSAFPYPPVTTDGRGRFYLPAWTQPIDPADAPNTVGFRDPNGDYRTAYYPGVPYAEQGEMLFAAEDVEVAMTMTLVGNAATATGTVWWYGGEPAHGIEVAAIDPTTGYTVASYLDRPLSRCDGTFSVTGLWPGTYRLDAIYFTPPQNDPAIWAHEYVTLTAAETEEVGEVMLPSNIIDGRVTAYSEFGPGIAGVRAELYFAFEQGGSWELYPLAPEIDTAVQLTNWNGEFRLFAPPIYSNSYLIRFEDPQGRFIGEWYNDVPLTADDNTVGSTALRVMDNNPYDTTGFMLGWGGPRPALAPVQPPTP